MTEHTSPPNIEVTLVTGLSGAGRGTSAKVLEDLDWYVADNIPAELVPEVVDLSLHENQPITRLAMVLDVRSRAFTGGLETVVSQLRARNIQPRILFLEASDAVLVRRFEQVRRSHPLQGDGTLLEGISAERTLLAPVRGMADVVIDTSNLSVHDLRARLEPAFEDPDNKQIRVAVLSFGFKYGVPLDVDMVVDVRFLPNPHWIPELKHHTGQDDGVRDYVLSQDGAQQFLTTFRELLAPVLKGYRVEGKRYMTIGVGCTGGKHRSVAMTEAIVRMLSEDTDLSVRTRHRDLGKE
ncbi:RNase adapter RapZ [Hoyosella rhizosphaerae]|uniref:Nucleotide-binding protein n=1 Tax=Hoyosella rhizosphaerae TaxID=1755582 RepID=A0A916U458_9ACTN|nr:RNase adapter RapZ [Hoyosella rhizosphaerae]GGC59011.1 nucleotide-binding protein [Hoyosella rhizosphaerae]